MYMLYQHRGQAADVAQDQPGDQTEARLYPNVMARSQVLEYREAKAREWEAAERAWREAEGGDV